MAAKVHHDAAEQRTIANAASEHGHTYALSNENYGIGALTPYKSFLEKLYSLSWASSSSRTRFIADLDELLAQEYFFVVRASFFVVFLSRSTSFIICFSFCHCYSLFHRTTRSSEAHVWVIFSCPPLWNTPPLGDPNRERIGIFSFSKPSCFSNGIFFSWIKNILLYCNPGSRKLTQNPSWPYLGMLYIFSIRLHFLTW